MLENPINPPEFMDKNYHSRNPLIRFLLANLLRRIKNELQEIGAVHLKGIDVGCGEGHVISYLHHNDVLGELTAVDMDADKLDYARQYHPFCSYIQADITNLEFEPETFDYVTAIEVLEHIPAPDAAMSELRRVTRKNGFLVISVPHEPFFHWGNILRGKYLYRGGYTPDHVNLWNRNQFIQFISRYVEIDKQCHAGVFPWLLCRGRFKG